ncbi:MAG: hypothetical protein JO026_00765, partial [Patescibacteria group bacterium]|nr:hypothetical protein [Patescibacteria group bacterium]
SRITKIGAAILFGGFSERDVEIQVGHTSKTTGAPRTAIDPLKDMLPEHGLDIVDDHFFSFRESTSHKMRTFRVFLTRKTRILK